jgi:hypothetical protein
LALSEPSVFRVLYGLKQDGLELGCDRFS